MKRDPKILQKYLDDIILYNVFPTETFTFNRQQISFTFTPSINLSEIDSNPIKILDGISPQEEVLRMPAAVFQSLLQAYADFCADISKDIIEFFSTYCSSEHSSLNWLVYETRLLSSITNCNRFQYNWILFHKAKEKEDQTKLITDVIKVLQPWLNLDLYKAMQKANTEETRQNSFLGSYELSEEGMYEEAMKVVARTKGKL
jgi:hypothetical protein